MINFFRKTRKKLADDNKPLKYLKYAIGEVVLVVIGILIALSINNWNTERINRNQEKGYLNRLVIDLERDLVNLHKNFENHQQRLVLGKMVVDKLGENSSAGFLEYKSYQDALVDLSPIKNWVPEQFGSKLFSILRINLFHPTRVTFDEMISSGKIEIIQDQNLRTLIQEYYPKADYFQNFQDIILMTIQENYRSAMNENNISTLNEGDLIEITPTLTNINGLIVAIENYMGITRAIMSTIYYDEDSMIVKANALVGKIKNEIDSN